MLSLLDAGVTVLVRNVLPVTLQPFLSVRCRVAGAPDDAPMGSERARVDHLAAARPGSGPQRVARRVKVAGSECWSSPATKG